MTMNDFALVVSQDDSFADSETKFITDNFVCAVCHAELQVVYLPNDVRALIVCIEHGNVCYCGRVTRNTVGIQLEQAYARYHEVIRNLPDLWGSLIENWIPSHEAHAITTHCVCAVCGQKLLEYLVKGEPNKVELRCQWHGNINQCGYIERGKFVYDYDRIKAYEKKQRESKVKIINQKEMEK